MVRHRIMDAGPDAGLLEMAGEFVPPLGSDHVHVIDRGGPGTLGRGLDYPFQSFVVARGDPATSAVQPVEILQPDTPHRGLDLVEAEVVADLFVRVLVFATVIAQLAHAFGNGVVVRANAAAVAQDSQVLRREKGERTGDSHRTDRLTIELRALGL